MPTNRLMLSSPEIRAAFWSDHPDMLEAARAAGRLKSRQNEQPPEVREAFCNYLDYLHRSGRISDALASRATL